MKVDIFQILEALGPFAAIDATLVSPFIARASGLVSSSSGMPLYEVEGNTGIITIEGALSRKALVFWGEVWFDGYDRILQAVQKVAKDPDVDVVLYRIESPGGAAQGLGDTAQEMYAALKAVGKPSIASVSLGASAAYYLASIADEIYVESDGGAGSIGTYSSHYDLSRALDRAGVTITRIQDPEGKTAGDFIRPLDDEGKARLQEVVSSLSQSFYEHVGARRGMTPTAVRDLNARVFYGQKAVDAKLADGVLSYSMAKKRAGEMAQKRKKEKMADLSSFLGLPATASAEEISKAADEAKPLLSLGRKALTLTGESNAEAAGGVLSAWKLDASDAEKLRAEAAKTTRENDAKERHSLLVQLAQVEPPSRVWADTNDLSKGPVQEFAEMSTAALRAFVNRRAGTVKLPALQHKETAAADAATDAEVKAYMAKNKVSEFIARAALGGGSQ